MMITRGAAVVYSKTLVTIPFGHGRWIYTDRHKSSYSSPFLRCFSCKTAFLKSKFKDDPVRVQRITVPHFKDLE